MSNKPTGYKFSKNDQKFMLLALNLSKKHIGFTAENPTVGCVIVKNNKILATGITKQNGRPHAENVAINKAKTDISNSTIYITLEPCSHFGKTEPCVDIIINKKIARVVIAIQDPDSRVNGEAIKKLEDHKIETQVGLFETDAKEINRGFFKAKTQNKPFITLKLATSLDDKIAKKGDSRIWLTNEQSRKFGHYLRARNNAILVGANTVRIDDPKLDCRIEGLEEFSPIRIVLSKNLDLNLNSTIFQDQNKIKTYIATNSKDIIKIKKFTENNIEIINFQNLNELLNKICELGINNLLIEGGSEVSASFLKENLVDEIYHFQSNKILGEDAISAIWKMDLKTIKESSNFKTVKKKSINEDTLTILRRNP